MSKQEGKKLSVKNIFSHLFSVIIIAFLVLYHYFDWISQAKAISSSFDAIIRSVCIIVIALEINRIIKFVVENLKIQDSKQKTTIGLLTSMVKIAVIIVSIVLILTLFVEDTSSLFTGIGMLGMVVGLGCNKLIADIVAGIFIVLEGEYQVGDTVVLNGTKGEIKEVGIRTTQLLDSQNNIRYFNNSSISSVTNHSKTTSGAMIEVGIDYNESIDRVEEILERELPKFKEEIPQIIAGPFYKGVQELADSAVILRIIAFTTEDDRGKVRRRMNKKIKNLFDEYNISMPYPQLVISKRED